MSDAHDRLAGLDSDRLTQLAERQRAAPGEHAEWIAAVVADADRSGCRDWPFGLMKGYPCVNGGKAAHAVLRADGRPRPPAPGDHALHSCDRPICMAPWHLRWGTNAENMAERDSRGRHARLSGEDHPMARLTAAQVADVRSRFVRGVNQTRPGNAEELADEFGVTASAIRDIAAGRSWRGR